MAGHLQHAVPESAHAQVCALLDQIRAKVLRVPASDRKVIEDATDCIETLSRAYGEIEPKVDEWMSLGLTATHARLLHFLIDRKGCCVTIDAIMNALYFAKPDNEPPPKIVSVYICQLRQRLRATNIPYRIDTIRAIGYKLVTL